MQNVFMKKLFAVCLCLLPFHEKLAELHVENHFLCFGFLTKWFQFAWISYLWNLPKSFHNKPKWSKSIFDFLSDVFRVTVKMENWLKIFAHYVLFNRLSCFWFAISNEFSRFLLSMRCGWNGIQHIQLCLLSNWKFHAWMQCTNVHSWSDTKNLSDDYL